MKDYAPDYCRDYGWTAAAAALAACDRPHWATAAAVADVVVAAVAAGHDGARRPGPVPRQVWPCAAPIPKTLAQVTLAEPLP